MSFWGWESANKAGKRHLYLEVAGIIFLALLVVFEALEETNTTLAEAFKRAGTVSLAALVIAEIARIVYGLRSDKLTESDAEAKLHVAQTKIASLQTKLLETLGPRKLDSEKRARMAAAIREMLPTTRFVILLHPQTNDEDQKEALDFAFDLSVVFGDVPVCTCNRPTDLAIEDTWICSSFIDPEQVMVGTARVVAAILKRENIRFHGPLGNVFLGEVLIRFRRAANGDVFPEAGISVEEFRAAFCIAVGKRSQPVFRIDIEPQPS